MGQKLYERYERHLFKLKQEAAKEQIESDIRYYLKNETLTFGANEALELEKIVFDWPNYWEQNQAPTLQVVVRVTDPTTPSYKQVQEIQDNINSKLSWQFQGLELQMQVQRINVSVVQGNEVDESLFDLEQILNEADTALAPMQVDEEELEDPSEAEICSEPNC